ncbi:hypothetical protein OIO90_002839 [Microbotryomycetes sp. JL221]|nr:hypothetical protein OIO90_002839 [Microbotryomycetes sp. JL221]
MHFKSLAVAGLAFATALVSAAPRQVQVTLDGQQKYFFDTDGNAIDSTSGKVDYINGVYSWIGVISGTCGRSYCGIGSWTSQDLSQWQYQGLLYDPQAPENAAVCNQFGNCGRPKVLYNASTKKYVLYMFSGQPGLVVFTSDKLSSGYVYVGRSLSAFQPPGFQSWDHSLAKLDNKAYVIHSSFDLPRTIQGISSIWPPFLMSVYIEELTADYLNTTGTYSAVTLPENPAPISESSIVNDRSKLVDALVEAPDLFKRGDQYYLIGSQICSFCNSTGTLVYRSKSLKGPWQRQNVNDITCGGQAMGIFKLPGSTDSKKATYLYQADLFSTSPVSSSTTAAHGHGFWVLDFNSDGSVKDIDCNAKQYKFTIPAAAAAPAPSGRALSATDGSGEKGRYLPSSDIPGSTYFQTWTSSKGGNLQEIGVNVAALAPLANLTITVFRYKNKNDIFNPLFKWEELATTRVGLSVKLVESFASVQVPVNKQVKKGDLLGFSIGVGLREGSGRTPPYHILVRNDGASKDHSLYALYRGGVSALGKDFKTGPVYELKGKELKWHAIVN